MPWVYFCLLALISGAIFYVMLGSQLSGSDKASRYMLLATAIVVPVISLTMYQQRGASDEVALVESMQILNEDVNTTAFFNSDGDSTPIGISANVKELQRQLEAITEAKPDRAEYWFLLGSLHTEIQDFSGAVDAYKEASRLFPEDLSIHARLAEAQFLADDYRLTEDVRKHIDRVLSENPSDTTVLGILGISAYRAGQFDAAIRFWAKSLQALPPMSAASQSIRASIEQAKLSGGIADSGSSDRAEDGTGLSTGLAINLDISIAGSVNASANNSVFVFARQFNGPPMPVVVERIAVGQLPMRITLDDSKVMIQGRKLADFPQLELVARLSFSGQPMAQKGDYEVVFGPVNPVDVQGVIALEIVDRVAE